MHGLGRREGRDVAAEMVTSGPSLLAIGAAALGATGPLPGEAVAQHLAGARDDVAAVVADEALESQGGDLSRRVERLSGVGGKAGRRLADDAVLEAQRSPAISSDSAGR